MKTLEAAAGSRAPALRLVSTQDLSREDWLAVRRTGIGGSDAAAAVGLNPYMSALELWLDKTGRGDGLPRPDPADTTSPTYWGTLLEPIVAAAYTQQTGNRVRKVNAVLRHPTISFMLANLDREIVGDDGWSLAVYFGLLQIQSIVETSNYLQRFLVFSECVHGCAMMYRRMYCDGG
ncbi:MAG: YqaJ viral recombinase family protein [Paraburkholderia sp.]|jgi:putative phage-type endonuclease|uniref:YqaJ viral recombinase family nuclease n=1 Tax=Burkholderia sp. 4M9327F10 TaxID=2502223 RepID=UPI0020174122|nr:YqaJ viral recombinase family protein [Burkholderia sp. 4M9327F10]